jgi:hypothetical protein
MMNKHLVLDILRMKRCAMALMPSDASQCYDRIHHVPCSLALRSAGIPKGPILSSFTTLQESEHHVATAYGILTQSYGGKQCQAQVLQLLQGLGQGNGTSPAEHNQMFGAQPAHILQLHYAKS